MAIENENKANQQSQLAIKNEKLALDQKEIAEQQRSLAKINEQKALVQKDLAQREKRTADSAKELAEQQQKLAIKNEKKAVKAQRKANKLKNIEQAKRWVVIADKYVNVYPDFSGKLILAAYDTLTSNGINIETSNLFSTMKKIVSKQREKDHFSKSLIEANNFRDLVINGEQAFMGSSSGQLINYNFKSYSTQYAKNMPSRYNIRAMEILEKLQMLIIANVKGELIFRNTTEIDESKAISGKKKIKLHNGSIKDLCVIDDSTVVSIGFDSLVKTINIFSGEIQTLKDSNKTGRLWSLTKNRKQLFVSTANNELIIFNENQNKWKYQNTKKIKLKSGIITSIKYINSLQLIAVGSSDGEMLLYNPKNGVTEFSDRKTHTSLISSIDHRDNLILTSSHDKKVVVWRFSTANKYDWQKQYLLHKDEVYNAKFINDKYVISQGEKETNYWTFSLDNLYNEIKRNLKNQINFTKEEIDKYELFLTAK